MTVYPINVSVIIPIYNVEQYIERCARSLFEQTLENIEFVFVNDCTPDKSIELLNKVIDEYPSRKNQVKIISHLCNKGVASARNTGLNNSTGEYVGWVDPDDWIEVNMFERLFATAKNSGADLVWCDYYINSSIVEVSIQQTTEHPYALLDAIMKEHLMGTLYNKLIRRDLYVNNNLTFLDGVNMAEDANVLLKVLTLSPVIKYISESLYHYNINNNNSLTHQKDKKVRQKLQYGHIISLVDAVNYLSKLYPTWLKESDMILYKLLAKRLYLFSSDVSDFKSWVSLFPETNSYVFSCPYTKLRYKIVGWMAVHHWWLLVRIWTKLRSMKA